MEIRGIRGGVFRGCSKTLVFPVDTTREIEEEKRGEERKRSPSKKNPAEIDHRPG